MSCWRRTTVLRIPAVCLGFVYWREWDEFLNKHRKDFDWSPGHFSTALCESYMYDDYSKLPAGGEDGGPCDRIDMGLLPGTIEYVPGPFLDYYLDETAPLQSEDRTYHQTDCARPLEQDEIEQYLPMYQSLFPDFTAERMNDVHYCSYEWYDGAEASYFY